MAGGMMRLLVQSKRFGHGEPILGGLDLALDAGQALAVLGPSGAGKSTFLRIAAGLDTQFEGAVTGRPARIGFQFQAPALLPWRSALDNVALACGDRAEAMHWLEALGVAGAAQIFPGALSLGMARRVSLARALAVHPGLLILDEPTASLDKAAAGRVHAAISAAQARFRPIILIATHEPREAVELAGRQLLLGARSGTAAGAAACSG